jgi:DNA-directed RNA polymerase subunit RPC12/RpoP
MARLEVQVPCPHCGRKLPLALDQLQSGAATACPHCGRAIAFQGGGGDKVQQALDLLGDQVKNVKVNVTVRRKS